MRRNRGTVSGLVTSQMIAFKSMHQIAAQKQYLHCLAHLSQAVRGRKFQLVFFKFNTRVVGLLNDEYDVVVVEDLTLLLPYIHLGVCFNY